MSVDTGCSALVTYMRAKEQWTYSKVEQDSLEKELLIYRRIFVETLDQHCD